MTGCSTVLITTITLELLILQSQESRDKVVYMKVTLNMKISAAELETNQTWS